MFFFVHILKTTLLINNISGNPFKSNSSIWLNRVFECATEWASECISLYFQWASSSVEYQCLKLYFFSTQNDMIALSRSHKRTHAFGHSHFWHRYWFGSTQLGYSKSIRSFRVEFQFVIIPVRMIFRSFETIVHQIENARKSASEYLWVFHTAAHTHTRERNLYLEEKENKTYMLMLTECSLFMFNLSWVSTCTKWSNHNNNKWKTTFRKIRNIRAVEHRVFGMGGRRRVRVRVGKKEKEQSEWVVRV